MSPQEIVDILKAQFPAAVGEATVEGLHPCVTIAAEQWHDVARCLRDDPRLGMNMLRCVTALDGHPEPHMDVVYDLLAMRPAAGDGLWQCGGTIAVRVRVPRDGGHVRSVADVWPTADWHEREAFDLLGVPFDEHPDLRRILCPDNWVGNPLRKDYVFPTEFEGIPAAAAGEAERDKGTK